MSYMNDDIEGGIVKRSKIIILFIMTIIIFHCGTDFTGEGKVAFNNGNYSEAIKHFTRAQEEDSTNRGNDKMICLAYLYRGEELFKKTRNIQVFSGNFEKAQKYIPIPPDAEFNKVYSEILLALANAYLIVKPANEEEKDYNFDKAVSTVKQAIEIDSTNAAAESLMVQLKEDHFQGLIDKGENYYKKAGRRGNADLYFTAEYYLKEALEFESDNKRINNLLYKIIQKTLPVLNYREGVSMAVAGYRSERKATVVNLSIKNYTSNPVNLKLDNFKLVDSEGNQYSVNEDEMKKRELFGETCIKNTVLNAQSSSATGIVAFDAPQDIKIAYIQYQINGQKYVRKRFP